MFEHKKIKMGKVGIEAFLIFLSSKKLILLKGRKGYVMCGYLNLRVAEKFKDVAVKVTGVSTIEEAINSVVSGCTSRARQLGIRKGQSIRDVLKAIA